MKISTQLMFDKASQQMSQVQSGLAQGKQVLNPSDAPDQAATIQRLKSILSRQDSFQAGLNTVKARLEGEDSTLKSVNDLIVRSKEIVIQANNDSLSPSDRKALGTELQALRDQMLSLANTRDSNGNYLFSGSRVSQAAFSSSEASQQIEQAQMLLYRSAEQMTRALPQVQDFFRLWTIWYTASATQIARG
jgi:flagellar hook-associated protein 3 FlgL